MEVVASLSPGRPASAQCGLFTYKSVPVIFEPPCILIFYLALVRPKRKYVSNVWNSMTSAEAKKLERIQLHSRSPVSISFLYS